VRYVCFADEPFRQQHWEVQPAWLRYPDARRNSRISKILAHIFLETKYSIYHDACLNLQVPAKQLIDQFLVTNDVAMFRHPCRKSVYEEMDACRTLGIGYGPEMETQVERYKAHNIQGLWSGGVIIRRHTDLVALMNELWWTEYIEGCPRDQIAFPMARAAANITVTTIKDEILQNPYFAFNFHGWHRRNQEEFADYFKKEEDKWKRLKTLCPLPEQEPDAK